MNRWPRHIRLVAWRGHSFIAPPPYPACWIGRTQSRYEWYTHPDAAVCSHCAGPSPAGSTLPGNSPLATRWSSFWLAACRGSTSRRITSASYSSHWGFWIGRRRWWRPATFKWGHNWVPERWPHRGRLHNRSFPYGRCWLCCWWVAWQTALHI